MTRDGCNISDLSACGCSPNTVRRKNGEGRISKTAKNCSLSTLEPVRNRAHSIRSQFTEYPVLQSFRGGGEQTCSCIRAVLSLAYKSDAIPGSRR